MPTEPKPPRRRIDSPQTCGEAMDLALDWAVGKRSWANLGPHEPYTPAVIAAMDAQEVVKWTAVAVALAELERIRHA